MLIVYDCEIINCIPSRDGQRKDCFNYCEGWHDHANMGISVIGVGIMQPHYTTYRAFVLDASVNPRISTDLAELQSLFMAGALIGFNSKNFDDKLIAACGICDVNNNPFVSDYDLLEGVRIAAYGSSDWRDQPKGHSYSLNTLAVGNGLNSKTGSGELAPELWQSGRYQDVIDYCLHDVVLTVELLQIAMRDEMVNPNTGIHLKLENLPSY